MSSVSSTSVSLTPDLERFVQERIATGNYRSAIDVIRDGLQLLEQRDREREVAFQELKADLQRAAAQAERGELIDGEKVFEELRDRSSRRRMGQE